MPSYHERARARIPIAGGLRKLMARWEDQALADGHQNAGIVSLGRGFLPMQDPLRSLPASHCAWDQLASELPSLVSSMKLAARLEEMPLLEADTWALGDHYLRRAAVLLGLVAHSCYHFSYRRRCLPISISLPWKTVCCRLRRSDAFLSYEDLIAYNWIRACEDAPLVAPELSPLIPVTGSRDESLFYMTQVEFLASSGLIICSCLSLLEALERRAHSESVKAIATITAEIRYLSGISFNRLTHQSLDEVRWARTVAPVAVSPSPYLPGPSGTASPLFHLMDAIVGRKTFTGPIGVETLALKRLQPLRLRYLLNAFSAQSLSTTVAKSNSREVEDAFLDLKDAYAGPGGLIARHRRRVHGLISVAFSVGRSLTIGQFRGCASDPGAARVDEALRSAIADRCPERHVAAKSEVLTKRLDSLPSVTMLDLQTHDAWSVDPWVQMGSTVYAIAPVMEWHPGGKNVQLLVAGTDATLEFNAVGHPVLPQLEDTAVATIRHPGLGCSRLVAIYQAVVEFTVALTRIRNSVLVHESIRDSPLTSSEPAGLELYDSPMHQELTRRFLYQSILLVEKAGKRFAERAKIDAPNLVREIDSLSALAHVDRMMGMFAVSGQGDLGGVTGYLVRCCASLRSAAHSFFEPTSGYDIEEHSNSPHVTRSRTLDTSLPEGPPCRLD